ncbi:MAG TPA: substrate-binding domain-containing protein [Gaiellaceae bacterium]|jgi:phosphate transport system substrate-binding protein|nr:substrate-binding domain-containing protein [Gaiellaceae bacterium]
MPRIASLVAAAVVAGALATTGAAAAAGGKPLKGTIVADGSSTVAPWTTAAAESFQRKHSGVRLTVGISGTGGGFSRFCRGDAQYTRALRQLLG